MSAPTGFMLGIVGAWLLQFIFNRISRAAGKACGGDCTHCSAHCPGYCCHEFREDAKKIDPEMDV